MPILPVTQLDQNQVLRQAYDEVNSRLRVDAKVSATISDIDLKDPITGYTLKINSDGSINTNTVFTAAADSIKSYTADGTGNLITSTANALDVNIKSGTVSTTNSANGTSGLAVPSQATQIAGSDGTFLRTLKVSATGVLSVDGSAVTQPISAASLPLPTGASTSALQSTCNASLASIDAKLTNPLPVSGTFFQTTQPVSIAATVAVSGPLTDTQLRASAVPVSGTVTANIGTTNGLALDSSVNSLLKPASTLAAVTTVGSITSSVTIKADTAINQTNALKVDGSAVTQPVSAASLPLPAGAATSALQTTGNSSLNSIDTKTPALGQALAASSVPVVLTAAQLATLTPLSSVTVSGTVTANAGTNLNTSLLALDSTVAKDASLATLNTSVNSLLKPASTLAAVTTVSAVTAITNALPVGANVIGKVSIDQTTPGTTNLIALSAETTKVIGTVNVAAAQTIAVTQATAANLNATIVQATPANLQATVTPIAITKGIQGATGFTTQDLKDAGRNQTNYFMAVQIVTTVTDTLMALTGYKGAAAIAATTTPAVVTAAKTYRLTAIVIEYTTIATTVGSIRFTLRAQAGGVVLITSPAVNMWEIGIETNGTQVAGQKMSIAIPLPDGVEFPAGTGVGLSLIGIGPTGSALINGYGRASIQGYEY